MGAKSERLMFVLGTRCRRTFGHKDGEQTGSNVLVNVDLHGMTLSASPDEPADQERIANGVGKHRHVISARIENKGGAAH